MSSTPADLLRWMNALLGGKVVSKESLAQMMTPSGLPELMPSPPATDGSVTSYGLGLLLASKNGALTFVGHNGGLPPFSSFVGRYLDDDLTVASVSNTEGVSPR
jgi:CubicO group peptidase (beta-lactamase class C family)